MTTPTPATSIVVTVAGQPIDPAGLLMNIAGPRDGAVASFIGSVRDDDTAHGGLQSLRLDHYPAMTESSIAAIADACARRWPVRRIVVRHRVGMMVPGDVIVAAAIVAAHRAAAFDALACLIDRLKTEAPFWKKEYFRDGTAHWVDARPDDDDRRARWDMAG